MRTYLWHMKPFLTVYSRKEGIDINPISSAQQEMRSRNVDELRLLNWQTWVKIQLCPPLTQACFSEP